MKKTGMASQYFVLAAAILWGTTGSAQAFAPKEADPMVVGALRLAIGGVALFMMAAVKKSFGRGFVIEKKPIVLAALCMAVYQPLFFYGVSISGIALGTVLALGSAPVFSGVVELLSGNKLESRWIIATAASIAGCVMLFSGQGAMNANLSGVVFSLGAGLSYAVYIKTTKRLFSKTRIDVVNGIVFLLAAIILFPVFLFRDTGWIMSVRGIASMTHLGLIATAMAYTLFAFGLKEIPTSKEVSLTLAEPLTAAILGVLVFGEKLTHQSFGGAFLLFIGLIVNSISDKTKSKTDDSFMDSSNLR